MILLDVRTKDEFDGSVEPSLGRLNNAINLPIQELEAKIATLSAYKQGDNYLLFTQHQNPKGKLYSFSEWIKRVTNMAGGMSVMMDIVCKDDIK